MKLLRAGWAMHLVRVAALALVLLAAAAPPAAAQCAMCRANAAALSSGKDTRAMQALNAGIFILLIPPVAFVVGILVVAFRYRE